MENFPIAPVSFWMSNELSTTRGTGFPSTRAVKQGKPNNNMSYSHFASTALIPSLCGSTEADEKLKDKYLYTRDGRYTNQIRNEYMFRSVLRDAELVVHENKKGVFDINLPAVNHSLRHTPWSGGVLTSHHTKHSQEYYGENPYRVFHDYIPLGNWTSTMNEEKDLAKNTPVANSYKGVDVAGHTLCKDMWKYFAYNQTQCLLDQEPVRVERHQQNWKLFFVVRFVQHRNLPRAPGQKVPDINESDLAEYNLEDPDLRQELKMGRFQIYPYSCKEDIVLDKDVLAFLQIGSVNFVEATGVRQQEYKRKMNKTSSSVAYGYTEEEREMIPFEADVEGRITNSDLRLRRFFNVELTRAVVPTDVFANYLHRKQLL